MAYITPKPYPLYNIRKSTDWRIPIHVKDADKVAFDFTGWQARAQVRKKTSGTFVCEFDTYDLTIEFDAGTMYLIRDKDDTDISAGIYEWDCLFFDTDSILAGNIIASVFEVIDGPTE